MYIVNINEIFGNLVSLVLQYDSYRPVYHVDDDVVFKFRTSLRIEFTEILQRLGRNLKSNDMSKVTCW